jgi:hypothetical protein
MGLVDSAAAWLARTLQPLVFASQTDDSIVAFAGLLGWTLPSAPPTLTGLAGDLTRLHTSFAGLGAVRQGVESGDLPASQLTDAEQELTVNLLLVAADLHGLPDGLQTDLPAQFVSESGIDTAFEGRLFDWLICTDLARWAPAAFRLLHVLGIVEETDEPADPAHHQPAFVRRAIRWDRFSLLAQPGALARDVYGWGTPALDADRLFGEIVPLSFAIGTPAERRYPDPAFTGAIAPGAQQPPDGPEPQLWLPVLHTDAAALMIGIYPQPTTGPAQNQGLVVTLAPAGALDQEIPLSDTLTLTVQATTEVGGGAALVLSPDHAPAVILDAGATSAALTSGQVTVQVTRGPAAADPGGTGHDPAGQNPVPPLQLRVVSLAVGAEVTAAADPQVFVEFRVDDGSVNLMPPDGDGLLSALLPAKGITTPFTAGVRWSNQGLAFTGSADLTTTLPVELSVGPLELRQIQLGLAASGQAVSAQAAVTVGTSIGPVQLEIEGLGIRVDLLPGPGSLGPFGLTTGATAPTGIGLSVSADVITGGGAVRIDPQTGRYSGLLQLRAGQVGITGVGLLDTRLPGRSPGYALLIALQATFPAIEVGFGFALTGVGGLLALNRRVDVDALRGRLASGTADRILAPQDPVRNAPALLADLDTVFPVSPGVTVVGPTAQLIWAGLVHLDIGVFVELPGPARIVLLGSAHADIEQDGRAYLSLRVDIVGVIDLRAETAAFDAVLINSHLLGTLDVTGGAAFRMSWGAQPYAVLSLGGFNPAYHPEPLSFPATLAPVAMVHGTPSDELYLRFEGYFAITSNTLQFGASVEAVIHSGDFSVHGTVGFDALIQFVPFHFQFDIRASVTVAYRGHTLAGLTLTGSLTGPGPVVLQAKVCIELLFFDICYSGTFQLGPSSPPPAPVAADLMDTLTGELANPARLRAAGAPDPYVTLQPPDPSLSTPVVSPAGTLAWEQQRAPLGLLLTRVGGTPLPAPAQVTAASAASSAPQSDWFAPGQFTDLSDDQALTRPAYELLTSGLRLADGGITDGPGAQATLTTRQIRLPASAATTHPVIMFPAWLTGSATRAAAPAIAVTTESWILTAPAGDTTGLTGAQARQLAAHDSSARAIPATDRLAALAI